MFMAQEAIIFFDNTCVIQGEAVVRRSWVPVVENLRLTAD
jgi:hypothetical protein